MPLPRLLRTASFRLAALYAVLFGGSVLISGAAVFWATRSALEQQVTQRIEAEMTLLQEDFQTKGLDHLVATVQERARMAGTLDYFIVDSSGRRLAGDLPTVQDRSGWVAIDNGRDTSGEQEGESERVRTLIAQLEGGIRLGVGEDVEQLDDMKDTFLGALAAVLGIVFVLGMGGGLLLSAAFLRRVDAITRTAEAIIAGDLSRRIEQTGSNDDFDRLSATLNLMLDRIAGLLENLHQVSNDIAHDLRTPLSHLRQRLENARVHAASMADYERAVDGAIEEADALFGTFSALLRIAQIEAGARRASFRDVNLSEVMHTVADAYGPVAEDDGRSLRAEIEDALTITGDRELLVQLFSNLAENALRHTPPGTTTTLHLALQPNFVMAEVADDGPGIPEKERAKVFRRFYRLERSRTSAGNGLGLSMVAAIADLHHAAIEVLDNRPGLRVQIRFPRQRALGSLQEEKS